MSKEISHSAATHAHVQKDVNLGHEQIHHSAVNLDAERRAAGGSASPQTSPNHGAHHQHQTLHGFMLASNARLKEHLEHQAEHSPHVQGLLHAASHINISPHDLEQKMPALKKALENSKGMEPAQALDHIAKAAQQEGALKGEFAKHDAKAHIATDKPIGEKLKLDHPATPEAAAAQDQAKHAEAQKAEHTRVEQQSLEKIILQRAPDIQRSLYENSSKPEVRTLRENLSAIKTDQHLSTYPHLQKALENRSNLNPDQKIDSLMQSLKADGLLKVVGEQRGTEARRQLEHSMQAWHHQMNLNQNMHAPVHAAPVPSAPANGAPGHSGPVHAQPSHTSTPENRQREPLNPAHSAPNLTVQPGAMPHVNQPRFTYQPLNAEAMRQVNVLIASRLVEGRIDSWNAVKRETRALGSDASTLVRDVETLARLRSELERHLALDKHERARHLAEIARLAHDRGANLDRTDRNALKQNLKRMFRAEKRLATKKLTKLEKIKLKMKTGRKLSARERMLLRKERKRMIRAQRVVVSARQLRAQRPGRLSRKERRKAARSRRER